MNSPADFLWWTDDILSEEGSRRKDVHPDLHSLMHGLSYRRLLKRALAIAPDFIKDTKNSNFKDLEELNRNHREHRVELRKLAKKIWLDAGSPCPLELVWLDLPKPPGFKESHAIQVRKPNGDLCRLNEFFNTDQWAEHFNQHKWRGHVFAPDDCAQAISISARKILEQEFALEFDPIAWQICHLS